VSASVVWSTPKEDTVPLPLLVTISSSVKEVPLPFRPPLPLRPPVQLENTRRRKRIPRHEDFRPGVIVFIPYLRRGEFYYAGEALR
jgi:hypothetical protein